MQTFSYRHSIPSFPVAAKLEQSLTSNTEPYEPVPSVFPVGTTWSKKYCCNLESLLDQPGLLAMVNTGEFSGELSGKHVRVRSPQNYFHCPKPKIVQRLQKHCSGEVPTGSRGYALSGVAKSFSFYYWGRGEGKGLGT